MTAFPSNPFNGQVYTLGSRSWVYSEAQDAWIFNRTGPTGPVGPTGTQGPAGVLLTSLNVDTFTGDGISFSFPLSITPVSVYNMIVNVDGLVQTAITNYTISGSTIIFAEAPIANATIDVVHFLTGSAITGPPGTPGSEGPTGPRGTPGGPTGPTGSQGPTGAMSGFGIAYASGTVADDVDVYLNDIGARFPSIGNKNLQLRSMDGNITIYGSGIYVGNSTVGSVTIDGNFPLIIGSTPASLSGINLVTSGEYETWTIVDKVTKRAWRITGIVGPVSDNTITIERLV